MKVIYFPFNNKGLGVDRYDEEEFVLEALKTVGEHHIEEEEDAVVLFYLSEPDNGFTKAFSKRAWPKWLKGMNMIVRSSFDQDEGDKYALQLSDYCAQDVIEIRPYPEGVMTQEEAQRMHNRGLDVWGWRYVVCLGDPDA